MRKLNNPGTTETKTQGNKHILFRESVPKFKIDMPVVNEMTLYLSTFQEDKVNLAALLHDIRSLKPGDTLKMVINSPGGLVNEGRAIINTITTTGVDIQTELVSQAASMAAIMFCVGHRRVIYENSSIMFHNFSGGFAGKGGEIEAYIKHTSKNLDSFFRSYIIGLDEEEIKAMQKGEDFWFDAKEMCKRGIATHVMINGLLIPATKYLKILKKTKKVAKKEKGIKIRTLEEALGYDIDSLTPLAEEYSSRMQEVEDQMSEIVANNEFLYT
jgi:ATP-dependent protease ClpP protease subunit